MSVTTHNNETKPSCNLKGVVFI